MSPIAGIAFLSSTPTNAPKTAVNATFDSAKNPNIGPNTPLSKLSPSCAISPRAAPNLTYGSGLIVSAYSENFFSPCSSISFKKACLFST